MTLRVCQHFPIPIANHVQSQVVCLTSEMVLGEKAKQTEGTASEYEMTELISAICPSLSSLNMITIDPHIPATTDDAT